MNRQLTKIRPTARSAEPPSVRKAAVGRPCTLLPLTENALPLVRLRSEGQLRVLGRQHMAIQCAATTGIMPGGALAIGVSGRDERTRYAAAIVDRVCRLDDGRISVRARVGGALAAILEHELLRPAYRLESLRFEYVVSARILGRLADVGILERTVVDRVYRCPQCGGLPICRSGCNTCHSPLVQTDELIHHYACAHVGSVEQFRDGDRLRCSKCQMGPLIIGSDFEYLPGLHTCLNCSRTGSQLQLRGTCTLCHHDFQVDPSTAHDLIGFRPNRLDLTDG